MRELPHATIGEPVKVRQRHPAPVGLSQQPVVVVLGVSNPVTVVKEPMCSEAIVVAGLRRSPD